MRHSLRRLGWLCVGLIALGSTHLRADTFTDEEELTERIRFLEQRLKDGKRASLVWYGFWTSFYAAGAVAQLARGAIEPETSDKADLYVSAGKAFIGVSARAMRPPLTLRGAIRHSAS